MKLQQLRYALEVYKQNLNVSEAADVLFTSQPGISKQIRLLEEELGIQIFVRQGKRLVSVTEPGLMVLETAERILRETQNIKKIGDDFSRRDAGRLVVASSPAQARYLLPGVVQRFSAQFPDVELSLQTGHPAAVCAMVEEGDADIGIALEEGGSNPELCRLPCFEQRHCLVMPLTHPLARLQHQPSLKDIATYPLITENVSFEEQSDFAHVFREANLVLPRILLSSSDADVVKTHVRLGMGVGLICTEAFDAVNDGNLYVIDTEGIFPSSQLYIVLRRDRYLRGFMYDFITCLAPALTREVINRLLYEPVVEDYSI